MKTKQDTIQDLRVFEEKIFDVIQEYIDDLEIYSSDASMVINKSTLDISIENAAMSDNYDIYPIQNLVEKGDDDILEPCADTIADIASKYFFVR